jgi:SulP family sulfate permease
VPVKIFLIILGVIKFMNLQNFTPKIFTIIKNGYGISDLKSDIVAGFTVAIIAIPLAMALAIASGTSPDKGLITAIIAGFLISLFGGSRVQIGGPTGAFVVVIFNTIINHGFDGLILSTITAGFILVALGYLRFGQAIKFIPRSVITGFTAGIAIIIASSQIKDFLGLNVENVPADFIEKWSLYLTSINSVSLSALSISLSSLFLILFLHRFFPRIPSYIVVVGTLTALVAFFGIPVDTIGSEFPNMSLDIPFPSFPEFTFLKFKEILPSAFVIAFLAGIESLLSAMVSDGMTGFKHRSNQELVGQGIANIFSGLFGGIPASGAIARTVTNIKSGGKTPFAGIFHSLFLLLFVLFGAKVINLVPLPVLSAILLIVAWNMSEKKNFINIYKSSKNDRIVLLTTLILTVFVDLTVAISVGVILASILFMRQMSSSFEISRTDSEEDQRLELPKGVEVFNITGPIFFTIANNIIETFQRINQPPKVLIVRMSAVPYIDSSGVEALRDLANGCRKEEIQLIISGLKKQPAQAIGAIRIESDSYKILYGKSYREAIELAKKITQI